MAQLVFASGNANKLAELAIVCRTSQVDLELAAGIEIVEDGATLAENAALKASAVARQSGRWALGDDTGLFVDALQGAPGVLTARYAGPVATAQQNREKLLAQLAKVPLEQRTAYFECCLVLADPQGRICASASGRCSGVILAAPQGSGGFGYDGLFLIREYRRTLAELSLVTKSVLSHRGRAARRIAPQVVRLMGG